MSTNFTATKRFRWQRHTLYKLMECPTCGALVPTPWARKNHREWHARLAMLLALAHEIQALEPDLVAQILTRVAGQEVPAADTDGEDSAVLSGPWGAAVMGAAPSSYTGAADDPEE